MHQTQTIDFRTQHLSAELTQVTHDDCRIEDLQSVQRLIAIDGHGCLLCIKSPKRLRHKTGLHVAVLFRATHRQQNNSQKDKES